MSTENTQVAEATGGISTESTSPSISTTQNTSTTTTAGTGTTPPVTDPMVGNPNLLKADASGAGNGQAPVIPAAGAFTPNFKYKAAMQEKELDPFWHPLIKDPDSEKKVKEVFTKVEAFEYMKDKAEKREKEFESLRTDFETQAKVVQKVMTAKQNGDLDSVFRNIGLDDQAIFQWAAKKIDYIESMRQMSPEQRMQIEAQQKAALQNEVYEEQLTQMKQQMQAQATQAREIQLDVVLSRPEITQTVGIWDQKMGYQGAFRDAVIEEAQKHWYTTYQQTGQGVDLTPEQAADRVLKKFANFLNLPTQGQPQATQAQGMNGQVMSPQANDKPVIPVIQGSSKTPIKKQIRSIEDIKKRAKELEAQQGGY